MRLLLLPSALCCGLNEEISIGQLALELAIYDTFVVSI